MSSARTSADTTQPQPFDATEGELSPHQLAARERALRDFPFFCRNFLRIRPKKDVTPKGERLDPLVPFVWNQAQKIAWGRMLHALRMGWPIRLVICKARQFGISTLIAAWLFWNMWRSMYQRCLLSANMRPTLQVMLETINIFYNSLPEGFRPRLREGFRPDARIPRHEVYFADRQSWLILCVSKSVDITRGHAFSHFLSTEVASYEDPEEFFGAFTPAMADTSSTSGVWESSPADGWFWNLYKRAKRGEAHMQALFLPWFAVPELYSEPITNGRDRFGRRFRMDVDEVRELERCNILSTKLGFPRLTDEQMLWRRYKLEEFDGDDEFFNQEYPSDDVSCFERATLSAFRMCLPMVRRSVESEGGSIVGEGNLHSTTYMDAGADQVVRFLPEQIDQDGSGGAIVWEFPKEEGIYAIGVDVADETDDESEDSAFSVISVYRVDTHRQVAEWRGNIDPHDLGDEIAKWSYYYGGALVNLEINNMGITTLDRLMRYLNFQFLFRWPKLDEQNKFTHKRAWYTNAETKRLLIGGLRYAIKEQLYVVRSEGLREELSSYRLKGGYFEPGPGTTADRIIAAALAWQCVAQVPSMSSIALGNMGGEIAGRPAQGQAKSAIEAGKIFVVRNELPDEFEGWQAHRVEDVWEAADL